MEAYDFSLRSRSIKDTVDGGTDGQYALVLKKRRGGLLQSVKRTIWHFPVSLPMIFLTFDNYQTIITHQPV